MKSLIALIKREYLEHRGAFLYAPAALVLLLALILLSGVSFGRFDVYAKVGVMSGAKGFEFGFFGLSAMWMFYLLVALFFYFADAFSADARNNAMLFWKSMPQSDFKILASKMLAGLTVFPALILGALILSGVVVFIGIVIMLATVPGLTSSDPAAFFTSAVNILGFDLGYLVLALLWYSPFFAWVGLLSALFRRWSIPLAFLIPGLIGLAEKLVFDFDGPRAGYFLSYLSERMKFGSDNMQFEAAIFNDASFNAPVMISRFLADIDWSQLVGGLIVAALLVYASSEYRRRTVAT
jgi:ABC-2 type transport system permease protein